MSLLKLPPDTEKMRKLLFDMPVPFSIRADVFDRYWMLCDSFWSRYNEITLHDSNNVPYNVIRWFCRLAHREPEKEVRDGEEPPPKKRSKKDIHHCTRRIKAFVYRNVEGAPDHYQFEHANAKEGDWQHGHTQDDADKHRINSFLKSVVSIEVARGFTTGEAWQNLRDVRLRDVELWNTQEGEQTERALDAAGGKYLTRQHAIDVRNSLRRSSELNRIDRHSEIAWVDTAQIWPVALGNDSEDYNTHAEIIRHDVATLITSVDLGGRTEVPSRILMPLLNSIAAFMAKPRPVPERDEEPPVVVEEIVALVQTQPVVQPSQDSPVPAPLSNGPPTPIVAPPTNGHPPMNGPPMSGPPMNGPPMNGPPPPHYNGHPKPPFYPPAPGFYPQQPSGPYPPHPNQQPGYPPHLQYPPPGPMYRPPQGFPPYPLAGVPYPPYYGPSQIQHQPPPYPNHPHSQFHHHGNQPPPPGPPFQPQFNHQPGYHPYPNHPPPTGPPLNPHSNQQADYHPRPHQPPPRRPLAVPPVQCFSYPGTPTQWPPIQGCAEDPVKASAQSNPVQGCEENPAQASVQGTPVQGCEENPAQASVQGTPVQGPAPNPASIVPEEATPTTPVDTMDEDGGSKERQNTGDEDGSSKETQSTGNEDGSSKETMSTGNGDSGSKQTENTSNEESSSKKSDEVEIRTDRENRKQKRKRKKKGEPDSPIQYRYVFERCAG